MKSFTAMSIVITLQISWKPHQCILGTNYVPLLDSNVRMCSFSNNGITDGVSRISNRDLRNDLSLCFLSNSFTRASFIILDVNAPKMLFPPPPPPFLAGKWKIEIYFPGFLSCAFASPL